MSQSIHHLSHAQTLAVWVAMSVAVFVAIGMSFLASLHARPRDGEGVPPNTPTKRARLPKTSDQLSR